jgi:hypothetical protein
MGVLVPKETQGSRKAQLQEIKGGGTGLVSDCSRLDVVHSGVEDRVSVESSVMARSDTEPPQP